MVSKQGMLVVVSGPAGVGKGTLCRALFTQLDGLEYSVSVTTRKARPSETEGKEYYFRTRQEFLKMIENNDFLEWAEFCGNLYGTPRFHVEGVLKRDKTILLEIDIQGAIQVKKQFPQGVFIFIVPPSLKALSKRLHGRGTETEEIIQRRLATAVQELGNIYDYDYVVENDHINVAVEKLKSIIIAEDCRVKRMHFSLKEE
ncbi:MAG: Guanylate kinase [Candidatus Dichloromethanomonas elyunquensis]|nr:MAG: Guanylate kinase [Candidatus Dichloromethanomonas elyunquensis]